MESVRVLLYGVGAIGSLTARAALERGWIEVVGAIDAHPDKVGRDLGEIIGLKEHMGVRVEGNAAEALRRSRPDVVLHATGSFLNVVEPQLMQAIVHGANVISTCETLAYPFYRYPEAAARIDLAARRAGVTVVGAGVNPGFLLDLLPSVLTSVCLKVDRLRAVRVIDAGRRRETFRKKIGLGLPPEEFERLLRDGALTAHVGYAESVHLIADVLGVKLSRVEEGQRPIISEEEIKVGETRIRPGSVRGVEGYGAGYVGDHELIKITFTACAGVKEEYEEIVVEGEPEVRWRSSGTHGDQATAAIIVNIIPRVLEAEPGITLVTRLRPPSHVASF